MPIERAKGDKKLSFLYAIKKEGHTSSCKDFILKKLKCQIIVVQ